MKDELNKEVLYVNTHNANFGVFGYVTSNF